MRAVADPVLGQSGRKGQLTSESPIQMAAGENTVRRRRSGKEKRIGFFGGSYKSEEREEC
jgi:hypothetical protein